MFKIIMLLAAAAATAYALLEVGDECMIDRTGQRGTCQVFSNCTHLRGREVRKVRPTICGYIGRQFVVCCPSVENISSTISPTKRISEQKCREYGEYVYNKINISTARGIIEVKRDMCGHKVIPLVVGGEDAKEKEFPHMALLGYNYEGGFRWSCGGSLISEQFVMTAAHCTTSGFHGNLTRVRLGELDISTARETDHTVDFNVAEIIRHPEYRSPSVYHDIALIRLDGYVTINPYVRPACLPTESRITQDMAIETAWGSTVNDGQQILNRLLKVFLELYTHAECLNSFPPAPYIIGLTDGVQESSQLCAGSRNYHRETCQSYSDGPLQIYNIDVYCTYTVIGITSFGVGCGLEMPGVYTKVFAYLDWIESIVWPQE